MPESSVTAILTLANTRHGPSAHPDWLAPNDEEHDHLTDPAAAREYLAAAGVAVPVGLPSDGQLADLRVMREAARALAAESAGLVRAQVEQLLPRYTFKLTIDGEPRASDSGWDGVAAAALPGLLRLLASDARVRTCGDPRCDWLFVDRSRNHSRQWCDMGICGSRAKMARYRERRRDATRRDVAASAR